MPPAPSGPRISYGPRRVPASNVMNAEDYDATRKPGVPVGALSQGCQKELDDIKYLSYRVRVEKRMTMPRRLLFGLAVFALLAGTLAFPATRASAQAFLDLFRVVNVAAVPVSGDRLK